jgi:hypothetical protein
VKVGRIRGQVHGDQDLLGDGFALDEGDQAQRSLACRADGLDPEDRRSRSDHLMYLGLFLGLTLPASGGATTGAAGTTFLREEACEESTPQ